MTADAKNPPLTEPSDQDKWQSTCQELRSAFHSWDKLPIKNTGLSPEEHKLREVKELLLDIKDQIQIFESPKKKG